MCLCEHHGHQWPRKAAAEYAVPQAACAQDMEIAKAAFRKLAAANDSFEPTCHQRGCVFPEEVAESQRVKSWCLPRLSILALPAASPDVRFNSSFAK